MKNSKLIKVLRTFNKSEFKQFGKFVHSPYFSSGRNVIPLFDELKKFYPHFEGDDFTRENILSGLSRDGRKASYALLKVQMSEIYKLVDKFLTIEGGKNETGIHTYFFARNCRKKGLYGLGESRISDSVKEIEKNGIDGNYYKNYYFGKTDLINFFFMRDKPLKGAQTLFDISEIQVHSFLCNVTRNLYNLVFFQSGLNLNTADNLLFVFLNNIKYDVLLKFLERKDDRYSIASCIYVLYILMILKPDEEIFYYRFKEKLFKNISIFSYYDQSGLLQLINFRAQKQMKGVSYLKFAEETFEIINFRLNNNLYKQVPEADYTANEFHSAFYIGFVLKKKQWLKNFMEKYLEEISPEQRDSSGLIGRAFIEFLESSYTKCLQSVNLLKGMTIPSAFDIKRLQMMALYEADFTEEAFYAFAAFKSYLRQNKNVSAEFMESNINFIKFYTHVLKHKYNEEESDLKKMLFEVQNSETANQEWLIQKIEELEQN